MSRASLLALRSCHKQGNQTNNLGYKKDGNTAEAEAAQDTKAAQAARTQRLHMAELGCVSRPFTNQVDSSSSYRSLTCQTDSPPPGLTQVVGPLAQLNAGRQQSPLHQLPSDHEGAHLAKDIHTYM